MTNLTKKCELLAWVNEVLTSADCEVEWPYLTAIRSLIESAPPDSGPMVTMEQIDNFLDGWLGWTPLMCADDGRDGKGIVPWLRSIGVKVEEDK